MKPAALSQALSKLFPPGAIAADLRAPGEPELLLPAEAKALRGMVPKRAREYAAGRLCARRALAELGVVDFAAVTADDRQPIWPDSMVGSITHTAGFCAAVIAPRRCAAAMGIDSEWIGDVKPELWSRICVPREMEWVHSLPAPQQAARVRVPGCRPSR
jgi:4'-phosphopantetheinyl transferase EntD